MSKKCAVIDVDRFLEVLLMEIINSANKKRTLLLFHDRSDDLKEFIGILEKKYRVKLYDNSSRELIIAKECMGAVSAVIVCASDAAADNYSLFEWLEGDSILSTLPVLIYCTGVNDFCAAGESLKRGAVDVIVPPLYEEFVFNRIENAIRMKDSATFYEIESMLKELPSNIYLKDAEGRYIFATHYWHHLDHSDDPDWTIRGKTDIDIRKDKENAINSMKSDMELLRTGKGTNYVIEINEDGIREFFEIIKRPVRDCKGNITGIIALINDVTESELLRISLEEKAMKDELTGADNRHRFDLFVSDIGNSSQLPISFISADCNDLKVINDTYGHLVGDEYIRTAVLLFRMILPANSLVFRTGGDEFVMVLPNTDENQAEEYVRKLKEEAKQFKIKDKHISISYGASCLKSIHQTVRECLEQADKKMYIDKKEHKRKTAKI